MTDTNRFRIGVIVGGLVLSASACDRTSKVTDSKTKDRETVNTLDQRPGPVAPMQGCTTRFAIRELPSAQTSCVVNAPVNNRWKLLPLDPQGGHDEMAWRTTPTASADQDRPFCVYEWKDQAMPRPEDFNLLGEGTEPECGLSVAMQVAPQTPPATLKKLYQTFKNQARGSVETAAQTTNLPAVPKLKETAAQAPTIAVVDATPFGLSKRDTSGHGFTVSRVIADLACADTKSPECERMIKPYMALTLVRDPVTKEWVPNPNGGYIGPLHELFRAFSRVLRDWGATPRKSTEHLIINLSLGWDPIKTDPDSIEVRRMHGLLARAYCEGVLVVAAAGNETGSDGPVYPAAFETEAPPSPARCRALGLPTPQSKAAYRPLVHAVGAVDQYDNRMSVSRPWGQPRLAAYAMQVVAPDGSGKDDGYTTPLAGTSMSSAIVSAIASAVWSARPELDSAGVMAIVYDSGERIDSGPDHLRNRTEFCLGDSEDQCRKWPVRRASLCRALKRAVPKANLSCLPPVIPEQKPPEMNPKPPEIVEPCRLAACGVPTGPMDVQLPSAVLPMPGVASCPACELVMGSWLGRPLGTVQGTWDTTPSGVKSTTLRATATTTQQYSLSPSPTAGALYQKGLWMSARPTKADVLWIYDDGVNQTATTPLNVR